MPYKHIVSPLAGYYVDTKNNIKDRTNQTNKQIEPEQTNGTEQTEQINNLKNKIMKTKVKILIDDLKKANNKAKEAFKGDDGGTCNLDSVIIKLRRWSEEEIKEASVASGVRISGKLNSNYWNGYRFLSFETKGQANERTRMTEAAYKEMRLLGYDVCMYYHAD